AVFALSLYLYASTLVLSVLPADNGEFQLVAWKLGIAHPPGYSLYTIAGFLFSRFFVSPAFALNLLSAVLASITLVFVSRAVRAATSSIAGGLAAAAILGTSTTFWAQATTANIRMPTALFTAWCVYALVSFHPSIAGSETASASVPPPRSTEASAPGRPPYSRAPARDRHLATFAIVFSLGLGHHPSLLFPGIFFIIYLIWADPSLLKQPRRWLKPAVGFLLGSLILFYLPIRGATGGTLANGEATAYLAQPDKFLDHVLARGFEGDFFYFVNTRPDLLGDRIALLPTLFNFQFNLGVLLFGVLGVIALARRNARLLVLLLGGIGVHTLVALAYRAPQTVEYMLPAYVLFATLIGCGIASVATTDEGRTPAAQRRGQATNPRRAAAGVRRRSFVTWGLALLALATGAARGLDNLPSYAWLAQHEDTRDYASSLLGDAPSDAIILSNWHWANPMWYLQQVEGLRPDVSVVYVFPRGERLAASWLNGIVESLATGRPVVIDMVFREEFAAAPYVFEPISREAFLVRESPRADAPSGFTPLEADLGHRFRLLGYRLLDGRTSPAEPLTLFLAWRVEAQPDRDYSFFVHLVDPAGRVIGQSDRALPTTRYKSGAVIVERFFVAPLPNVTPGDYLLVTGAYSVENGNVVQLSERVQITEATIQAASQLTGPPAGSAIALAHGLYFLNATPTTPISNTLVPGSRLTLDLRFAATRPLTRDFVVSVQMLGQGQAWKATSDSVPALGAIPTLKWIAGSGVVDRHVIDIPRDALPGPAAVSLILYDNFTQQPLALLDEQLIRRGQSIPLGTYTIAAP
ncbi:MAG TPA: DUF2723 domain-containing protein, partial [Anaerolineae bacterium]|nr:DUF2723 domain-containing protein [Anaerolineae bacterium]